MMVAEKEDFAGRLKETAEKTAERLGCEISGENLRKLIAYGSELQKWNKAYNLVGRKIGIDGLIDLIRDAMTPLSIRGLFEGRKEVLDIGSGAGLPGIPLYLASGSFPLTLVESQRKKVTFLRHICRMLEIEDVRVHGGRLEEMIREEDQLNAYEVGLARAVMEPVRLLRLARPLLCEGGRIVLYLGKADAERIRKGALAWVERGYELQTIKSTQRLAGKDNYLAVLKKTGR